VLWSYPGFTAVAYRPVATPPKKGAEPRTLTLDPAPAEQNHYCLVDRETKSHWDVAGRAVAGELKGWTLEWLDGTVVRWFAWAAEYPDTTIFGK
jgi:hypothetical protein